MKSARIFNNAVVKLLMAGMVLFLVVLPAADACTNSEINVGVTDSLEGRVVAKVLKVLILERTGVRAGVKYFSDSRQLDAALKNKKVEIIVENTANALKLMKRPPKEDPLENFQTAKTIYKQERGVIWLKPLGYTGKANAVTSLLVTEEIIKKFPGLPRVLNKLSGLIDRTTLDRLKGEVQGGAKDIRVAEDFLDTKRLI